MYFVSDAVDYSKEQGKKKHAAYRFNGVWAAGEHVAVVKTMVPGVALRENVDGETRVVARAS